MIRFACPGCGGVFTVEDDKAGKTGMCPKCAAQFQIPAPQAGAAFPPPPPVDVFASRPAPPAPPVRVVPVPPPPPPAVAAVIELVCPGCKGALAVSASDLGTAVECPYCKKVFTANRPGAPAPSAPSPKPKRTLDDVLGDVGGGGARRRAADDEGDQPRRGRPRGDEDDRPARRSRARSNDDEDEDDRPARRSRRTRRRGAGNKAAVRTVSASMSLLIGLGSMACGVAVMIGGSTFLMALSNLTSDRASYDPQAAENARAAIAGMTAFFVCCGAVNILYGLMYVMAGVGALMRKGFGRVVTIIAAVFSGLTALILLLQTGGAVLEGTVRGMLGSGLMFLFFTAHVVVSFMATMGEGAAEEFGG